MAGSTLEAMKSADRWLLWRYIDGRKIPYYINGKPRSGTLDSPEDVAQLGSYDEAVAALNDLLAVQGYGLGFALGQGWQGIDLDDVEANGLADVASPLPGLVEVSPSGNGVHAIGYGIEFPNMGSDGSGIEAYSSGRYFTFTGKVIRDGELCDLSPFVSSELAPRRKAAIRNDAASHSANEIDGDTIEHLRDALQNIDPNPYETWFRTLCSLKTLGEQGRELAQEWSQRSPKYDHGEFRRKWNNITNPKSSYKAVFDEAKRNGWKNPGFIPDLPPVDISNATVNGQPIVPKTTSRFHALTASDLGAMPPMRWVISNVLPAKGIGAIYGPSRSGKTFLAFDMGCAIAAAEPSFGNRTTAAPVLFIGLEGEAGYATRLRAWKQHHQRDLPADVRFVLQPFRITDAADVQDLAAICPKGCVIFIDTLNRAAPEADENSSRDMGAIIEGTKTLQRLVDGLVVLIAHTGKDETKGLRGHSSLIAALDAAIAVSRNGDSRSWKVDKNKDGADGEDYLFKLEKVLLGYDEFGDEITSCVVVQGEADTLPGRRKPLTASHKIGMESFQKAIGASQLLHLEDWRNEYYRMSPADNLEGKRKAFHRARIDLVNLGMLTVNDNNYRINRP